jgi:hypothetical protein
MAATKLSTIVRQVQKASPTQHDYAVFELQDTGEWHQVSKTYAHSTSALAKLGRMYQADISKELYKK